MEDKTRKYIITSFWIIFVTLTIFIYTFHFLVSFGSNFNDFMISVMIIVLACIIILLFSFLGASNKLPFLQKDRLNRKKIKKLNEKLSYCTQCGAILDADSEFCGFCGNKI